VTKADGAASGGSAAVGIALGPERGHDSAIATTQREIDAAGDVSFTAVNSMTSTAVAKASAKGAEGEKEDGSTPSNGVDQQVGDQRGWPTRRLPRRHQGKRHHRDAESRDIGWRRERRGGRRRQYYPVGIQGLHSRSTRSVRAEP
jgi:hypothetical protein